MRIITALEKGASSVGYPANPTHVLRVIHATGSVGADRGGPSVSVPALVRACSSRGASVELVAQQWPGEALPAEELDVPCTIVPTRRAAGFGFSPRLWRVLRNGARAADLVHSHTLWLSLSWAAHSAARAARCPHVISPRGALEPWALTHAHHKKRLVRWLFQDRALEQAACIHALSDQEARNIRSLGLKTPIAVIPNGIDASTFAQLPARERFEERYPQLRGRKVLLFLSRIHRKKGISELVEAWVRLARSFPDWELVVAGRDEIGLQSELTRHARESLVGERITFTGLLVGEAKREALAAADLFVLPSHSEGFSIAVLEAMAAGVPTMITPECNFPEALRENAVMEISSDPARLMRQLSSALSMGDGPLAEVGIRGRALVRARYTWERVATAMMEVYAWCLGGGDRPAVVDVV